MRRQVQTHLLFGPLSRFKYPGLLVILLVIADDARAAFNPHLPAARHIAALGTLGEHTLIFGGLYFWLRNRIPPFQQAAGCWLAVKYSP